MVEYSKTIVLVSDNITNARMTLTFHVDTIEDTVVSIKMKLRPIELTEWPVKYKTEVSYTPSLRTGP